ncbi:MAG TPA: hypothetical protein PLT76_07875 [Candidatus Omnitrophota bacterium]|nr:hypothetical protein [Candidatus Omnitrophota bacterium]
MIMKRYFVLLILFFMTAGINPVCGESDISKSDQDPVKKITFDISKCNDEGLSGPPDGLVALSYEFCIPAGNDYIQEVKAIDPTVEIYEGSSGRIGCSPEEYLCIGNTHQKDFKAVLYRLAALLYVKRIDQCFWE